MSKILVFLLAKSDYSLIRGILLKFICGFGNNSRQFLVTYIQIKLHILKLFTVKTA